MTATLKRVKDDLKYLIDFPRNNLEWDKEEKAFLKLLDELAAACDNTSTLTAYVVWRLVCFQYLLTMSSGTPLRFPLLQRRVSARRVVTVQGAQHLPQHPLRRWSRW